MPKLDSALAAGSWSWVTVRGSRASREGRCRAEHEAAHGDHEDHPESGSARNALSARTAVKHRLADAGGDQQLAAVDVVGQRAAVQAEDDRSARARPGRSRRPRSWSR